MTESIESVESEERVESPVSERTRVLIMAGGTGGHVYPALAVAEEMQQRGIAVEWLGTQKGIEHRLVPEMGIQLNLINITGVRGKQLSTWLRLPWLLLQAVWQARRVLVQFRPHLVLGMGGFASGPGGLAAKMRGIPLVLHEQNAVAGTTNRWLSRLTSHRLEAFPGSLKNGVLVGNPVRKSIVAAPPPEDRYDITAPTRRVLIVGGSLGARKLNQLLPRVLERVNTSCTVDIWHQTGTQHMEETRALYENLAVQARVEPFIEDMDRAYEWADLIICRAGALTVSEISAVGVAALFIPYPHAIDDHQTRNAQWLVDNQAAVLCQERDLDEEQLLRLLLGLLSSPQQLLDMARKARLLAKVDASERVVDQCMEAARE